MVLDLSVSLWYSEVEMLVCRSSGRMNSEIDVDWLPRVPDEMNRTELQDLVLGNLNSVDMDRLIMVATDASLMESVGCCSPLG